MGLGQLFTRNWADGGDVPGIPPDLGFAAAGDFLITDARTTDWIAGYYRGGMSIPGAWRATILLSDLIGGVPWCAHRKRAGGPPEELDPLPSLLEQPNPPDVRMTTFSSMALDLIWEGNAIALIASRDRAGWPTSMLPIPAQYVGVRRVTPWDGLELPVGTIVYDIGGTVYPSDEVVHVKGPTFPGALRGLGVLENHLHKSLALSDEQARQARSVGTAGVPTGLLKSSDPEFDEDDARALKSAWMEAQRRRTVAVLSETTSFEAVAWNPSETQLLDARKFSLTELALIFGVPLSFLGAETASKTYSNAEQESLNLLKFSLGGHLTRFEQTLSAHLPRGTFARADLDELLRNDTLTRFQAYGIALDKGFLTADEVREEERRPPLTPAQRALMRPPPAPSAVQDPTPTAGAV
jgi:HK97 family phage portal protein